MGKGRADLKTEQVNVRLTPEEDDVPSAIAFLERSSAGKCFAQRSRRFLRQKAKDPQVQLALRARAEYQGMKSGRVARLPSTENSRSNGA